MESVEDIDVGHQFSSRLGWAAESLGSSKDSLVATANYAKGWRGGDRFLSLLSTGLEGYVNDDGIENGIAKATAQHFYFASPKIACTHQQILWPPPSCLRFHKWSLAVLPDCAVIR